MATDPIPTARRRFWLRLPRRLWIGLVTAIFIVPIGLYVGGQFWLRSTHLEWMEKTTGLRLPPGIRDVSVYWYHESFITAHVLLPASDVSEFARRHNFVPVREVPTGLAGIEELAPSHRTIPETAQLYAHTPRTKTNKWTYVLDRRTGHLWFSVEQPDWSGDLP